LHCNYIQIHSDSARDKPQFYSQSKETDERIHVADADMLISESSECHIATNHHKLLSTDVTLKLNQLIGVLVFLCSA